jgi:O-antigen/teichoic acid export membrane protein
MNLKKIIHFSLGPIITSAISLVTLPFISWFFSVQDVGRLTMLQVVLGLSVSLFSLSMNQAYVREFHEEEDKSALFKTAVVPGLFIIMFISMAVLVSPLAISNLLFGIESAFLTALLLVGIFSSFFINFLEHVVRMQERGLAFSATQIAPKAFLLVFIGLILLLNLEPDFKWLMLMNTLALFASLMIFAVLTRDTWLPALSSNINYALLKKMLLFSLPLVAGGLAYWGLTTMDRFFLRTLSGFQELGVYAISVSIGGIVSVISSIFSNLWHPVVYKWVKAGGVEPKRIEMVIENMLLVVALIWSLVGLLSWILPFFFPPEYQAIQHLIVACVAMPLFYMLSETTGVGIGINRRTSFAMLASICAFIVNLVLNYLLIPKYGAAGAALATLISFFVFFVIRTESSAYLWKSFPRLKVYFILVLYMIATSVTILKGANFDYFLFAYLVLLVTTISLYRTRFFESIKYLKTYLHKRS